MTVRSVQSIHKYTGSSTDIKPLFLDPGSTGRYLPVGSEFYETDKKNNYFFDGGGSWARIPEQKGAEKHSAITISITTSDLEVMSDLWNMPGRVLVDYLLTVPESTGTNPTFTLTVVTSGSTAIALYTSTAHPENASHYFPFSTNNTNVVVDEGIYYALTLSTELTAVADATIIPYSNG